MMSVLALGRSLKPTLSLLFLLSVFCQQNNAFSCAAVASGREVRSLVLGNNIALRQARTKEERHTDRLVAPRQKENRLWSSLQGGNVEGTSHCDRFTRLANNISVFCQKNFFLLGMVLAVSMAKALPSVGRDGSVLRPEFFLGRYGVTCIFLLSGLSLELSELRKAASNHKLNAAVQFCTFVAWPFLVGLPMRTLLATFFPTLLSPALLDGLLILTCLPTTVNMCIILTAGAGGNVASSLCNAVISNVGGIFLTPALLLRFFGASIQLPFGDMVRKLCNKVLLPVAVGQVLRKTKVKHLYEENAKILKRLQELILLGIVWNAFCNAFSQGMGLEFKHAAALLVILPTLHMLSLASLFKVFQQPFWGFTRGETVAAMFSASHKTLAFGLPLVKTVFEGSPNLAAYCAPIMFIHPLQLVLGSLLVPRLMGYTNGEENSKQSE